MRMLTFLAAFLSPAKLVTTHNLVHQHYSPE